MAEWSCGRQPLRRSHLPVLRPLCNALLLSVGTLTDLLLMNRIQQWWMSHPRLGYRKTVVSTLGVCLLFYLLTWKEADCCAASCPVPRLRGKEPRGPHPTDWEPRSSVLCLGGTKPCQSRGGELGRRSSPGEHLLRLEFPQPCGCASWDIWSKRQPNSA